MNRAALEKALYNALYYQANAEKWPTVYAENRRRKLARPKRRPWTVREDATMRLLYPNESDELLQKVFCRTRFAIYAHAGKLGLSKSPQYIAEELSRLGRQLVTSGKAHRFQKGCTPPNKGLRRPGWGPGRMKETQFKKGQLSGWAKKYGRQIGDTRLIDGYLYVKVAEVPHQPYTVNWKPLHVLNWERANGRPVPEGHCLWFRDGNRMNVEPGNLELITRRENMSRNTVHNLPKELARVVQLRGALVRQINKRSHPHEKRHRRSA